MNARSVASIAIALLCNAPRAQPPLAPAQHAFVEVDVPRASFFSGEAIDVTVRIGIEPDFLREHLVQTFRQRLDVPVEIDAPWLEALPGAEARGAPLEFAATATRSAVVNHGNAQLRPEGDVTRDGRTFAAFALVRRFVATRAAALALPETILRMREASAFDEDFFGERVPRDPRDAELTAPGRELRIAPLPEEGRPATFTGAVGAFTIAAALGGEARAQVGGSVALVVTIEGRGDLERITPPALADVPGFHVRGRVAESSATRRTVTLDLVPLATDVHAVPAIAWSFFDPEPPGRYREVATAPIPLAVAPAADGTTRIATEAEAGARAGDPPRREETAAAAPVPGVDVLFGALPVPRGDGVVRPIAREESAPRAVAVLALVAPFGYALALWSFLRHARGRPARRARAQRSGARAVFLRAVHDPRADPAALLARYLAIHLDCNAPAVVDTDLVARLRGHGVPAELAHATEAALEALAASRFGGAAAPADLGALTALVARLDRCFVPPRRRSGVASLAVLASLVAPCTDRHAQDPERALQQLAAGDRTGAYAGLLAALRSAEWDKAVLLYDLGNCAHALGRPAEAILWYRRALAVAPGEPHALANLRLVQRQLGLLPPEERTLAAALVAGARAQLAALPVAALLSCGVLLQVLGWTGILCARRRVLAALALAAGLLLAAAPSLAPEPGAEAIVVRAAAPLRSEPSAELGAIAQLEAGASVRILAASPRWARIRSGDDVGWTETQNLERVALDLGP